MALPKYKEVKKVTEKLLNARFLAKSREELGPFAESRRIQQWEGELLKHNTLDDSKSLKTLSYQVASTEFKLQYSEVKDMKPEDVVKLIDKMAKDIGASQAKYNYKVLADTVKEAGNSVDAKNSKPSVKIFFEILGKISMDFDSEGKPKWPSIVCGPDQQEKWLKVLETAHNPNNIKKLEEIIEQKKKDFYARQANRKLVD